MDTIGGGEVSLGDLADLTVTNDNDLSCDVSSWGAAPPAGPHWASHSMPAFTELCLGALLALSSPVGGCCEVSQQLTLVYRGVQTWLGAWGLGGY